MKKIKIILCLLLLPIITFAQAKNSELYLQLQKIAAIKKISPAIDSAKFTEKLVLAFEQPIDHKNPAMGTFEQRVIVGHVDFNRPTVIITEGYGAAYALRTKYREELSRLFNANMVFVEHRYFLESTPKFADGKPHWEYMTAENSAADLHAVRMALGKIYNGKWMASGISKGGETTVIYCAFYPNDVDVYVPYVAPICRAVEDGRHEPFIRNVSTKENRERIQNFQLEVLKRRATLMPKFKALCEKNKYEFQTTLDEIYDFCVLEYSFAFWQWGTSPDSIPATTASDDKIFRHFVNTAGPDYFDKNDKGSLSFNVQAMHELGYYGYDTKPFKKYLKLKTSKNYYHRIMVPESAKDIKFDATLSKKLYKFLKENDPRMIFIYGQNDPWTAAGATWIKNKNNIKIFIQPNGSHRARISNLPADMKKQAIQTIKNWLEL